MRSGGSYSSYPNWKILIVILLVGAVIGGWLGEVITQFVPTLSGLGKSYSVGIPRFVLDLRVLNLVLGLTIRVDLFSILGLIGAFLVYRRM